MSRRFRNRLPRWPLGRPEILQQVPTTSPLGLLAFLAPSLFDPIGNRSGKGRLSIPHAAGPNPVPSPAVLQHAHSFSGFLQPSREVESRVCHWESSSECAPDSSRLPADCLPAIG